MLCIHELLIRILWLLMVTTLFKRCGQTGKKSGKEEMNKRVENSNLRKGLKNCVAYNREEKPQCRLIVVIRYVKYCHIL